MYSLVNWGRTTNSCLHQLEVLQNKFIRTSLFLSQNSPIDSQSVKFQTLKLQEMITFEFAKFIFKFKSNILPLTFFNYFVDLNKINKHNTRQKSVGGYPSCIQLWVWEEKITLRVFKEMGIYSSCSKSALLLNLEITTKQLFWSVTPKTLLKYIILINCLLLLFFFFLSAVKRYSKCNRYFLNLGLYCCKETF